MPMDLRLLDEPRHPPRLVVVPAGSIEQHCSMPLGTDCLIAERLAWRACEAAEARAGFTCVIAPPLCYGFSPEWRRLPGTITLPLSVFAEVVKSITISLWDWGVERVVYLNAHGGNSPALRAALAEAALMREGRIAALIDYWRVAGLNLGHASELEANIARALGVKAREGRSHCGEAAVSGGGVYIYAYRGRELRALGTPESRVDVNEIVNKVADAIIKVLNADISKYWIG
ncbi:creatininase family protein [Stetteria hydrogenophila]